MRKASFVRQHNQVMVEVLKLLERFTEALDQREQRIGRNVKAVHVAKIEAIRDSLRSMTLELEDD